MKPSTYVATGLSVRSRLRQQGPTYDRLIRLLNQLCAAILIVLTSPIMLMVAWLIWRKDGRPVLFGHYRVGQDGQLFKCLKFRSMVLNASEILEELLRTNAEARKEWERDQKLNDDPRITPVGRFLRKTSLDELPQLFNVLRGDMSLVGPRPITLAELEKYGEVRWHYLHVRPGMTGLWQVSGRSDTTYEERVELDRTYIEKHTLWHDAVILVKTILVVLGKGGAR
ncbi:MAG: sugar transferase [Aquabacterium sp.]|uniref:sugar transferase n=1 Tax=Aquabacterium sp. TaxID=1872578 RepID=UPI002727CE6C|nr:sugar transferase [Aquabacterium sp.]MDO9002129.1 sugar transferase [Aquabacterium sp.]